MFCEENHWWMPGYGEKKRADDAAFFEQLLEDQLELMEGARRKVGDEKDKLAKAIRQSKNRNDGDTMGWVRGRGELFFYELICTQQLPQHNPYAYVADNTHRVVEVYTESELLLKLLKTNELPLPPKSKK
jgi:hypothetical protein